MRSRFALAFALVVGIAAPALSSSAQAQATSPLAKVTGLTINNLTVVGDQLLADATMTLDIVGQQVTQAVQFPISLAGTSNANSGGCTILTLSLGPINLDLLGLIVTLDDCNGGPVVVDVTGQDGTLLGGLLCGLADNLLSGLDLGSILGLLNADQLAQLTSGLTDLLNQVLGQILAQPAVVPPGGHVNGACPILNLDLPSGLTLTVLGLTVDIKPLCLDISAQPGPGQLLGNLLCDLENLLNNGGNTSIAQQALIRTIANLLNRLGL